MGIKQSAAAWLQRVASRLPFNPGNPKVQIGVGIIITLLLIALATTAHAEEQYSQFGVGSTVVRGPAPMIDLAFVYPDAAPKDAVLEVGATFIGPSSLNSEFQQNNFALRAAIVDGFWRFDVGLGAAYLQNTDTYNGSHVNFNLLLGYRFKRYPYMLRMQHFSNGGTQSPNKGRDMVGLYLVFR